MRAKAKVLGDWNTWVYGTWESPGVFRSDGKIVEIIKRTLCKDTGLLCKEQPVYEGDWLEVMEGNIRHRFLVVRGEGKYLISEDGDYYYPLTDIIFDASTKIVGNIYD